MLKLSDIQAQPWLWRMGDQALWMKPLSLSTFASAELYGCGLDDLMHPDQAQSLTAWVTLYAFLQGAEVTQELQARLLVNPSAFKGFVDHVSASFTPDEGEEERPQPRRHRRNKDPRTKIGAPGGPTMKETNSPGGKTDYAALFDLARYARISLGDLYQMTFKGLAALTRHLAAHPPVPNPITGQVD